MMRVTSLGQMTHPTLIDMQAWHSLEQQEPAFLWAYGLNHKTPAPARNFPDILGSCKPLLAHPDSTQECVQTSSFHSKSTA